MASGKLEGFGKSLGGLGGVGKVATAAVATVAASATALGAGLIKSVANASDFQAVISQVGAVSGATGPQLQALSDLALQMGADTQFSASQAAQAMAELAKGGIEVGDMAKVLPGVLDLAAAGGLSLAESATIATDTMAIFAKQGISMDQVANAFAGAANISSISVQDMAESMKYIGPIASSMGMSLEDTSAAIALLGANGLKGSQAGTGLRTMLTSLASPSKEAAGLIKDLGLNFFDSTGKVKDFAGIAAELQGKLKGMTDQQRLATLETLFGKEGMSAAIAVMGQGENSIASYTQKLRAASSAHATGVAMMDNFAGSMEAFKGSVESASITIGLMLLPYLRELVDWGTKAVNASVPLIKAWGPQLIQGIKAGVGQAIAVVRDFGAAIAATVRAVGSGDFNSAFGPIIAAIDTAFGGQAAAKVALFVSDVLRGMQLARDAVLTARQAFAGEWVSADTIATPVRLIGEVFTFLGDAARAVQGVLAGLPAPVLAAAAAFVALGPAIRVAAVVLPTLIGAFTGLGPIVSLLTSTLPLLGSVIAALGWPITAVVVAVGALAVAWQTNFLGIQTATLPVLQAIGAFITGTFLPALTSIGATLLTAVMPVVTQFIGFLTGQLLPGIQGIVAVAVPAFVAMGNAVIGAFQAALPGIQAFIGGMTALGAAVLPIVTQVAGVIIDSLGPAVMAIVAWAQEVIPQFAAAWSNVASIVGPLVGALATLIGSALQAIAGFITAHSAQITGALTAAWTVISNLIGAQLTLISGLISAALLAISGDWSGAWNRLVAAVQTAGGQIQAAVQAAMALLLTAFQAAMAGALQAVQAGLSAILGALQGLAGAAASAAAAIGAAIIDGIAGAISAGAGRLAGIASNVVNGALDAAKAALGIKSPSKEFAYVGEMAVAGLVKGMDDKQAEAAKKAAEVASAVAKAVTDVLGAMKAVSGFDFGKHTPTGKQLGALTTSTTAIVAAMQDAARDFTSDGLKAAGEFADAAGKVGGAIKNALEGLAALASFDFARSSPTGSALGWFTHLTTSLVANFAGAAATFAEGALKDAGDFADAAGKVGGSVKNALEGLQALAGADWAKSSPSGSAMGWFTHLTASLVQNFATAAAGFGEGALKAAGDFADAASKVGGAVKAALGGLQELANADWAKSSPTGGTLGWFTHLVASLVQTFAAAAAQFDSEALASANRLAETAGKVAGIIGPALAGFKDMSTMVAPSTGAIDALVAGIKYLVGKFAEMATTMEREGVKAMGDFADAAGKALGAAKTGTDLFAAFAPKDKDSQGLIMPSKEAIDGLVYAIKYVVARFGEMSTMLNGEGLTAMTAFASGAGQVLNAAKTGTDLFKSMEKLGIPSKEAIDYLLGSMGYVISQTQAIANGIGREGLQAAQQFAVGTLTVFTTIKTTLEDFAALKAFKDIPAQTLKALFDALEGALEKMGDLVGRSDALKESALEYLANMQAAFAASQQASSIGVNLGGSTPDTSNVVAGLLATPGFAGGMFAPAGVGGAAGGGGEGAANVTNYNVTMNGDTYGMSNFQDAVISSIEEADRRGRV